MFFFLTLSRGINVGLQQSGAGIYDSAGNVPSVDNHIWHNLGELFPSKEVDPKQEQTQLISPDIGWDGNGLRPRLTNIIKNQRNVV